MKKPVIEPREREKIIKDVASCFDVSPRHIKAKNRGVYDVSDARFAVYALLYATGMSLQEVGRQVGRNHGSVINGLHKLRLRIPVEKKLRYKTDKLKSLGYKW